MLFIFVLIKVIIVIELFVLIFEVGGVDLKLMFDMYLEKKCGCFSFFILEDINEKFDFVGYKLKL